MMTGDKMNAFIFDLSFIGWAILVLISCRLVGLFYVTPYKANADAELYAALLPKVDPSRSQDSYGSSSYGSTAPGYGSNSYGNTASGYGSSPYRNPGPGYDNGGQPYRTPYGQQAPASEQPPRPVPTYQQPGAPSAPAYGQQPGAPSAPAYGQQPGAPSAPAYGQQPGAPSAPAYGQQAPARADFDPAPAPSYPSGQNAGNKAPATADEAKPFSVPYGGQNPSNPDSSKPL